MKSYISLLQGIQQVRSLPVRGAWIEICWLAKLCRLLLSLPVRGAWIEIPLGEL